MFIKMSNTDKTAIAASTIFSFIGCGINISSVLILNELVKHLSENSDTIEISVIGKYVGALAGSAILKQIADVISQRAINSGVNKTTLNWISHINQLSSMQHDEFEQRGYLIGPMFRIQESLYNSIKLGLIKSIPDCVQILGVAIASSCLFEAEIVPIFWATIAIRSLAFLFFSAFLISPKQKQLLETMNNSASRLVDVLNKYDLIKAHSKEHLSNKSCKKILDQIEEHQNSKDIALEVAKFFDNILKHTATFFIFYMTAIEVLNDDLQFDIADFIVVITYFQLFLEPLNSLFSNFHSLTDSKVNLAISENILKMFEIQHHAGIKLNNRSFDISISDLWFRYKKRESEVVIYPSDASDSSILQRLQNDYLSRNDNITFYIAKLNKDNITCHYLNETQDGIIVKQISRDKLTLDSSKERNEKTIEAALDDDRYVISGMSDIEVNQGDVVAVVGKSGLGKTTFVQLLLGLYSNYEGSIRINDTEMATIDKEFLRNHIVSYLPQVVDLFKYESLGFNLKHAISDIDQDDIQNYEYDQSDQSVRDAMEHSESTPLLNRCKNGYGSVIGDNISGGQKQRLGIARLHLRDTKVFIMDEPTSSLDSDTEENIMRLLAKYVETKNATCFFITHKLAFAQSADKVLFFSKNGNYFFDTHENLYASCNEYQQMFNLQDQDNYSSLWHPRL